MSLKYEPASEPLHIGAAPLSSEYRTYKTVKARFWPWLSGESPHNLVSCSLFAGFLRCGWGSHSHMVCARGHASTRLLWHILALPQLFWSRHSLHFHANSRRVCTTKPGNQCTVSSNQRTVSSKTRLCEAELDTTTMMQTSELVGAGID